MAGFREMGQYWAEDNERFAATNPSLPRRILRYVNPLETFGSSMGDIYTASSQGDVPGTLFGAATALPILGAAKTLKGTFLGLRRVNDYTTTGRRVGQDIGGQYMNEQRSGSGGFYP